MLWDNAPDWATHWYYDSDGRAFWSNAEPDYDYHGRALTQDGVRTRPAGMAGDYNMMARDWRYSVTRRPLETV